MIDGDEEAEVEEASLRAEKEDLARRFQEFKEEVDHQLAEMRLKADGLLEALKRKQMRTQQRVVEINQRLGKIASDDAKRKKRTQPKSQSNGNKSRDEPKEPEKSEKDSLE